MKNGFEEFGEVISVNIISDRKTRRHRGVGFVEMDDEGAIRAIEALDGNDFGGRNINVNEVRPGEEWSRRWSFVTIWYKALLDWWENLFFTISELYLKTVLIVVSDYTEISKIEPAVA